MSDDGVFEIHQITTLPNHQILPMSENDKHRGRIFLHRGDVAKARACYEQAVDDDRLAAEPQALADSLGNLGNVCSMMGDYETANRCYREALTIQREYHNLQGVG